MLDSRHRMVEYPPSEKFFKKIFENPLTSAYSIQYTVYSIQYAVYKLY